MTAEMSANPSSLFAGPPRYVPESPWEPVPALLITIAACAIALVVGMLAIILAMAAFDTGVASSEAAMEAFFSLASPSGVAIAAGTQIASLTLIWLAAGRQRMRREVLQLTGAMPDISTIALGSLVLVAATSALEYAMYLTTTFDYLADTKWLREGLQSPYWWGTFIIGVVLAPLWEELTFRGFLLSALAKTKLGFWGGGLISNGLWTLLHWGYSWQGLVSVFAAGLILTWIMRRTGSIWAPIAVHAIANTCALAFAYYMSSSL